MIPGLILGLLWALFWCIVLAGVLAFILYGFKTFVWEIPPKVVMGIWYLFALVCLIVVVTVLTGNGGAGLHSFRLF